MSRRIDLLDDALLVRYAGLDAALGLRRHLRVPYASIRSVAVVLEMLGSGPAFKAMMAEVWRDGGTVRVVRRAPEPTASGKILPLHLSRDGANAAETAATVGVPRKGGGPDVTDSSTGSGGTSG